jgi:BMFP domain-containing protein YqiC
MATTPRHLPRFLPTLTEVVKPTDSARSSAQATPDLEEISRAIMQRIEPLVEQRLREEVDAMVRAAVTAQVQTLRLRLREELEAAVRQAVTEATTSGLDLNKLK